MIEKYRELEYLLENSIPGWKFEIVEKSQCHYQMIGKDKTGHEVSCEGSDEYALIEKCERYAFDVTIQILSDKNEFIYNYFCMKMKSMQINITQKNYSSEHFGSWIIEFKNGRFVYDGREYMLSLQKRSDGLSWDDYINASSKEIDSGKVFRFFEELDKYSTIA